MWEVGAIIAVVLVVDLCIIGIYKVLRHTTKRCSKKIER